MDYLEATRELLKVLRQERVSISRLKKILEGLNREQLDIVKVNEKGIPTVVRLHGEDYIWRPSGKGFVMPGTKSNPKRKSKRKKG